MSRALVSIGALGLVFLFAGDAAAQRSGRKAAGLPSKSGVSKKAPKRAGKGSDEIVGVMTTGPMGLSRSMPEIEQAELVAAPSKRPLMLPEREGREKDRVRPNPDAPNVASWPDPKAATGIKERSPNSSFGPLAPQTIGTNFTAATLADTGSFPPDSMGTVGPSQVVAFVNGRLRSFNKNTGSADGVLNFNPDVFFAPVMTPIGGTVVANFTTDPMIRYDRLSGRWILSIIDVPCTNAQCTTTGANRWLVAVSDAASSAALTNATVWTFFFVTTNGGTDFCDYPSLGVDNLAVYFGCNMFSSAGAFLRTDAFVVRKSSILGAGPIVSTLFSGLATGTGAGMYTPRGVDNYDPSSSEGYFVGVDNASFSTLVVRRVSTPGGTPTLSSSLNLTVPTTNFSNPVTHSGNTGGNNGRLDALDDRIYSAHIRNGRLWLAHNIRVSSAGTASTAAAARNAVRWYELNGVRSTDNGGTLTLVQSGTIFDNAAALADARQFWIPSVMVSGQGHAAVGFSMAGTPFFADAGTAGRLSGDTLGTMQAFANITSTATAYNPASDPGGASGRRWGDYSYTSLDPLDDMTMWTAQEFCNAANSYGLRMTKLIAPPPANIADGPGTGGVYEIASGAVNFNVVVSGTSVNGSGFYDPGPDLGGGARPFNHISASISGSNVTVNSVTYTSPTSITLNVTATGANPGLRNLTITNPDGQAVTRTDVVRITGAAQVSATVAGRIVDANGSGIGRVTVVLIENNPSFGTGIRRLAVTNPFGYFAFTDVPTGFNYSLTPSYRGFVFSPPNRIFSLSTDQLALDFTSSSTLRPGGKSVEE
ncbi:MAG: carboxypeptidase regulatory-like domain-containing protein [Acidobacteria bacterium]|nr:carboxypeptidase regulatory-like domain-containing protein [Acidobacteriota bacterium]MCW5949009.1 carboxypeptidase regulatory-like domain-containing protein [Pyrinomonadaceae bacterium]